MEALLLTGVLILFVGFAAFLVFRDRRMRTRDDDLRRAGTPASGTVVRLTQDAASGEDDLYLLKVNVHADDASSYRERGASTEIEVRAFLGAHVLAAVEPGRVVRLRIDPRDPTRAALDLEAMGLA